MTTIDSFQISGRLTYPDDWTLERKSPDNWGSTVVIIFIQPNYAYVFNAKKLKVKSGDSGEFSLRLLINWSFLNTVLYLLFESQIYMDLWIFIQTGKFHQITGPLDQWFFFYFKNSEIIELTNYWITPQLSWN